ncbi:hypothetical protein AYO49_04255 [Verrucomicrobiaceae bacterium SCGC AG-212-N21]|nr:hypothetical protein AYO49_04255 [Verrucomicrobiaceae bacterium SCGC AG-212-N21]
MNTRHRFAGMMQIVRFNPAFYAVGSLMVIAGAIVLATCASSIPAWMQCWGVIAVVLSAWWLAASLVVSCWVYDASDWPKGAWLTPTLADATPSRVLNVHAGFDETTERLRTWLPEAEITPLNVFDESLHTESSLLRARATQLPVPGTISASHDNWPSSCRDCDAIFFLLTAHEFRTPHTRRALLAQARQALRHDPPSVIVLAEHARDLSNFIAFGPGFLHFHSPATWRADWEAAGLVMTRSTSVTPFLRIWTLQPKEPA